MSDTLDVSAAGSFALGGELTVKRMGYGAMQLAGPGVMGPPKDPDEAQAVLRHAIDLGINHIDTSDYYGPHTVNQVIKQALYPYPEDLVIVTKVGARRTPDGDWPVAMSADELRQAVHDNLQNLGVEALDVVNLRLTNENDPLNLGKGSLAEPFGVLADLRKQGLIKHLGLSNVTPEHLTEAQQIAPVVCVQNSYNLANRDSDPLVDLCAAEGVAFTPFFPLGGFAPLQTETLDACAKEVGATPLQVALAWLLTRSPNILLIPGTSSRAHLDQNIAAASLEIPSTVLQKLNTL
jgi:pyridoxine 4-dehydrogenase